MSGSCWYYGTYGDFQIEKNVDLIEQLVNDKNLDERGYFIYPAVGTEDAVKYQSEEMAKEMLSRDAFTPEHYVFYQKDGGLHDLDAVQEYLYNALPLFLAVNVENKVIIITGASSGIGEETARVLAREGAKVVLSARREDRLKKLADEIGENAAYLKSDVVNPDDMKALVALAKEKFGRVDAVYANAGIMPAGNMSELNVNDWHAMIDINIKGVLNTMAAVLPEFTRQKSGHIIVTSSRAGTMSVPGNAVYCGTKHFVRAMLDSFRSESIREGTNIRTTTIYPGAIKTELLNMVAESEAKNMVSAFYENVGLTPDIIANAVLYAVSQPDNVAVPDLVVCPSMEG